MKYGLLGNSWSPGVRSGLGTMTFGEDWGAMPAASSLSNAQQNNDPSIGLRRHAR
jgi:hypothetical protein